MVIVSNIVISVPALSFLGSVADDATVRVAQWAFYGGVVAAFSGVAIAVVNSRKLRTNSENVKTLTTNNGNEHSSTLTNVKIVETAVNDLKEGQKNINARLDHHDRRFDNLQEGLDELRRMLGRFLHTEDLDKRDNKEEPHETE